LISVLHKLKTTLLKNNRQQRVVYTTTFLKLNP